MPVEIGGERAWRVYQHGDVGVAYHWINDEPAMVLFPLRTTIRDAGAYVIPLSAAYQYVRTDGYPEIGYCVRAAGRAAQMMRMSQDRSTLHRIIDAILDGLPDLIDMPPSPPDPVEAAVNNPVGELSIIRDGETILETEVETPTEAELIGDTLQ